MNSIAKKFSTALCERYNDIRLEEIVDAAERILQFLSEINAGEEAVNYLTNYLKEPNEFLIAFPRSLSKLGSTPPPSDIGARLSQKNS